MIAVEVHGTCGIIANYHAPFDHGLRDDKVLFVKQGPDIFLCKSIVNSQNFYTSIETTNIF